MNPPPERLSPEEFVDRALMSIPDTYRVMMHRGSPAIVRGDLGGAGFTRVLGLASDDEQLAVWYWPRSGENHEPAAGIERIGQLARLDSFDSVWLDPETRTVGGFVARLTHEGTEEQLVVIDSRNRPYVVRSMRTPNSFVELTDIDQDSIQELVEYVRVFEPQGRRELYMNRYEWDGSGFALASTTPLLREVNRYLELVQTDLENGQAPFPLSWLVPTDQPQVPAQLPLRAARLPAMSELPVEVGKNPWEITYRLAFEYEENVVIYTIGLVISPGSRELVTFVPSNPHLEGAKPSSK